MKTTFTKLVTASLIALCLCLLPAMPVAAQLFEGAKQEACEGSALGNAGGCDAAAEQTINDTIAAAINIISIVVGVIAVIMLIVGGVKYVMSSGDPAGTNSAKNTVLFAVVGLIIVALAQVIVRFILQRI